VKNSQTASLVHLSGSGFWRKIWPTIHQPQLLLPPTLCWQ